MNRTTWITCLIFVLITINGTTNAQDFRVSSLSIDEIVQRHIVAQQKKRPSFEMCDVELKGWLLATHCKGMSWIFVTDIKYLIYPDQDLRSFELLKGFTLSTVIQSFNAGSAAQFSNETN